VQSAECEVEVQVQGSGLPIMRERRVGKRGARNRRGRTHRLTSRAFSASSGQHSHAGQMMQQTIARRQLAITAARLREAVRELCS